MAINWVFPVRITQIVLAVIILGLTAYLSSVSYWYSPSQVNFLIFNSVWTFLVVAILLLGGRLDANNRHLAHKFVTLGLDALTMLFWFAGFIALAVLIPTNCRGSNVCRCTQAATVFGAFEWLLFTATTVAAALTVFRGRSSSFKSGA